MKEYIKDGKIIEELKDTTEIYLENSIMFKYDGKLWVMPDEHKPVKVNVELKKRKVYTENE